MRANLILAAVTFALISCDNTADNNFCDVVDGNYLQNPGFDQQGPKGRLQAWSSKQHAGEKSFELEYDDGELTITKIGTQPWLSFAQTVKAAELAGKKLAMTAELKLDLRPPAKPQSLKIGGGLNIVASGSGRPKLLLRSVLDHQPSMGKTDWIPVQVVVQLPEKTRSVDIGFLHQADGIMQIRNPYLQRVDESRKPCMVSPNAILGVPQESSGLRD